MSDEVKPGKLKVAPEPKEPCIKDYVGKKVRLKLEGATSVDVTLKGVERDWVHVENADGHPWIYPQHKVVLQPYR